MADANTLLHDALVRRQLYLSRVGNQLAKEIIALLDDTEADIRVEIEKRLAAMTLADGTISDFGKTTHSRLNVLANALNKIRSDAFDSANDMWTENMQQLAADEAEFLDHAYNEYAPVILDTVLPDPELLAGIVETQPMQGRLLSEWAAGLAEADQNRIMDQIRIGIAQGDTTNDISRSIFGLSEFNGSDGALEATRNDAWSITQTAINTIANETRSEYYQANSDIIAQEIWTATLDPDTCEECAALDGEQFDVGDGDQPPIHFNCRCVRVGLLDGEALGDRPANSATEDALAGLEGDERIAAVSELVGQVPASTTYQEWLDRQSSTFQDKVLGPTRGAMFRQGTPLKGFVNNRGDLMTLKELADAGLD